MASMASAHRPLLPIYILLLLLIIFASVAFSFQSGNPCDCHSSCSVFEGEAKDKCMRICTQICKEEPGIKDEARRRGREREERHPYHFGKERYFDNDNMWFICYYQVQFLLKCLTPYYQDFMQIIL